MKKTYKNPTLTVVNVQPAQFIASSSVRLGGSYNGETKIEGRKASFSGWNEEEE